MVTVLSAMLALVCVFPRGSEQNPSVIAPLVPTGEPIAFWWDDVAFHVGTNAYYWLDLKVKPCDGTTFRLPLGVLNREPVVLEATLDSRSHRLRIGSSGPVGDSDVKLDVNVEGSFDDTLRCKFRAMGQTPDYIDVTKQSQVKAGSTADFSFSGHGSLSGFATIEVTSGTAPKLGKTVTQDDMGTAGLKSSLSRTIYSAQCAYRKTGLFFDYQHVWTDRDKAQMHVVSMNWSKDVGGGCTMRVSAKDLKTMTMGTWTKTVPLKALCGEKEDSVFDVGDLPEGFYWMIVEYADASGNVIHSDRFRYFKSPRKMTWEGTELGNEDTVPPPWTKPEFDADGTFRCWNRTFRFGGAGLVSSLVNGGKEMLTEPIAVLLNGRPLAFDVSIADCKTASATYRLTAKDAPIVVDAVCDFDGYVRFGLTYGEGVESLAWRVSVERSQIVAFDDGRGNDTQDLLTDGRQLDRDLDLDCCRFWWMGGVRGLCGGLNTLRGLHTRDLGVGGHVHVDDKSVTVTTKLVDEPYSGAKRTARFYIDPTPMKPKNMEIATYPANKLVGWTGYCCEYYEMKYPGFEIGAKFKKFSDKINDGCRVFFYNATHALSPDSPFYGWYGTDWINDDDPSGYAHEVPIFDYAKTKNGRWRYGCTNSRSFFESKLWGVNWYFNNPLPEMKDLYFDVCNPAPCWNTNAFHACRFVDDFGEWRSDADFDATRDLHKRVYRLVKAKNADGAMYGHLTRARKPTDAFFDYCCMGEFLAWKVRWQDSYYEIFTPELMQALFVPRSVDMLVGVNAQFRRWRQCWAPDMLKSYNPEEPDLQRAIRHFTAYALIHGLFPETGERADVLANKALATFGTERRSWHYYDDGPHPVALSAPGVRQLWALYRGNGKTMLVVLNDTDQAVKQTVAIEGLSAKGKEFILKPQRTFDFTAGSCTLELGPRESLFILWESSEVNQETKPLSVCPVSRIKDKDRNGVNWWSNRFARNRAFIQAHSDEIDFVFAGSSSVHFWETRGGKEYAALTNRYAILNCGYRGDTTQALLWRFQNGELDGYRAKGIVLSIGSNNNGFKSSKVADTVAGIKACLSEIEKRQPQAKVVLLAYQPRAVGTPDGDPNKDNGADRRNRETSEEMSKMADGKHIFYVDVYDRFLVDGKLPKSLSADYLHPTEKGYGIIRESLEPILEKIAKESQH